MANHKFHGLQSCSHFVTKNALSSNQITRFVKVCVKNELDGEAKCWCEDKYPQI